MNTQDEIRKLIARSLRIKTKDVKDTLSFQSIPEWDSLSHVTLMVALEQKFAVTISNRDTARLTSVESIIKFVCDFIDSKNIAVPNYDQPANPKTIHRGLNGVYFDNTLISEIDVDENRVSYRGWDLKILAARYDFETVAYLLIFGNIPAETELNLWKLELSRKRNLNQSQIAILEQLKYSHPAFALRTMISVMGQKTGEGPDEMKKEYESEAIRFLACAPTIIANHHRLRMGLEYIHPSPALSHAANFLYMLNGRYPEESHVKALDSDLTIHAEHGSNASAFAARVAIGAQTDFVSALTAAISTFTGRVHGGALEEVLKMLGELNKPADVKPYIDRRMSSNLGVPGFGHRLYKKEDPRSALLLDILMNLSADRSQTIDWDIIKEIRSQMQIYRTKGLEINVDFYAGLSYRLLGIPDDMAVSIFFMARIAGLNAHILEQSKNNILIRPLLQYAGKRHEAN